MRQIRFRFDGQPINETDTPSQVSQLTALLFHFSFNDLELHHVFCLFFLKEHVKFQMKSNRYHITFAYLHKLLMSEV